MTWVFKPGVVANPPHLLGGCGCRPSRFRIPFQKHALLSSPLLVIVFIIVIFAAEVWFLRCWGEAGEAVAPAEGGQLGSGVGDEGRGEAAEDGAPPGVLEEVVREPLGPDEGSVGERAAAERGTPNPAEAAGRVAVLQRLQVPHAAVRSHRCRQCVLLLARHR